MFLSCACLIAYSLQVDCGDFECRCKGFIAMECKNGTIQVCIPSIFSPAYLSEFLKLVNTSIPCKERIWRIEPVLSSTNNMVSNPVTEQTIPDQKKELYPGPPTSNPKPLQQVRENVTEAPVFVDNGATGDLPTHRTWSGGLFFNLFPRPAPNCSAQPFAHGILNSRYNHI